MGIDLMSVSGHKIHGPKGTGALFIKNRTKVKPIIYGGGQQDGMRSGTENVPGLQDLDWQQRWFMKIWKPELFVCGR